MNLAEIYLVSAPGINPLRDLINRVVGAQPMGLASIGSTLIENGYRVVSRDLFNSPMSSSTFRADIENICPRIVGISVTTETYSNALRLARLCKQVDRSIRVVLGGAHVTFTAEEALQDDAVDVIVRGEGEFSMLEVVGFYLRSYGSLERIKGISFKSNGKVVNNPSRGFIQHLDEMPFVSRHLFKESYSAAENMITSRGCPGRCIFCSAGALSGGKYRTRSAENVLDEIIYLQRMGGGQTIKFLDDTVTADTRRLEKMLDLIEQLKIDMQWGVESRVDVVTEQSLVRMAKLGCVIIQFGVESGSQDILDRIRKGISLQQVVRAVECAAKVFKQVYCSFIIGLPFDTVRTIQETVDFALRLQRDCHIDILFSIATPFPGTYMYNHASELGLTNLSENFDDYNFMNPVFDTIALSKQQLRNLHFETMQKIFSGMPENIKQNYRMQAELLKGLLPQAR